MTRRSGIISWATGTCRAIFQSGGCLQVWPALELVLFRFTGVSLAAARALRLGGLRADSGLLLLACPGAAQTEPAAMVRMNCGGRWLLTRSRCGILSEMKECHSITFGGN